MRLILALLLLLPACAQAEQLKIATWNLNWLTMRAAGDRHLPADVTPRQPQDFDRLRAYAQTLNADVIAIEEVDGRNAAALVFPPEQYSIHMTHDHVVQRVGFAVRRGLHYEVNPDVTALSEGHLRSGADITLQLTEGRLRLLAVHLKEGCQFDPLDRSRRTSCAVLREQVHPLQQWIAARQAEGMPFLILGDFNREMDGKDKFLAALDTVTPLTRVTEGRSSPCWGREAFIDHILAGGAARTWVEPDSLRVLKYRETGPGWKERLSDHCPVSVRLDTPG
ncbi:MAG TPA: endonuclease/exonuclease/phosphatase family protein [Acetobacteraceae bacterium]|nr:endonuclease/exonuclease/phosphatase family protein [Acetobacteraceae bacterium]